MFLVRRAKGHSRSGVAGPNILTREGALQGRPCSAPLRPAPPDYTLHTKIRYNSETIMLLTFTCTPLVEISFS
jgi:hypothetical protein